VVVLIATLTSSGTITHVTKHPTSLFDADRFEAVLSATLEGAKSLSDRLLEAMRYALLSPGKRLRPRLVFAAGVLTQAQADALTPFAVALELIHTYSLIHDDLPAMDNDALRRGRPTVHVQFDEATAILAGDALQALAFETLAAAAELELAQPAWWVGKHWTSKPNGNSPPLASPTLWRLWSGCIAARLVR